MFTGNSVPKLFVFCLQIQWTRDTLFLVECETFATSASSMNSSQILQDFILYMKQVLTVLNERCGN